MITLEGFLRCSCLEASQIVADNLPEHQQLSLAEAGCLRFSVTRTDDPLIWRVEEAFIDREAFTFHQQRVAASEWGSKTAGIIRDYTITEE